MHSFELAQVWPSSLPGSHCDEILSQYAAASQSWLPEQIEGHTGMA